MISAAPPRIDPLIKRLINPAIPSNEKMNRLLLWGGSGVGKTTLQKQLHRKFILLIPIVDSPCVADQYQNYGTNHVQRIFSEILKRSGGNHVLIFDRLIILQISQAKQNTDK